MTTTGTPPNETRDSWGLTDADHAELQALMKRHRPRVNDLLLAMLTDDGGSPDCDARVWRGGFWGALLERLREFDRHTYASRAGGV